MSGINWEIRIYIYTLLYTKYTTSKTLLYNTGTLFNTLCAVLSQSVGPNLCDTIDCNPSGSSRIDIYKESKMSVYM